MTLKPADAARYAPPKAAERPRTLVDWANEVADIRDVLRDMGLYAPSGTFYSYKIDCPWNYEHADGGRDKNCRLFGGTNIYCWAAHGYITPSYLYSRWKGVTIQDAAKELLDQLGLLKKNWRETWNELVEVRDAKEHVGLGQQSYAIDALHAALKTDKKYLEQEFEEPVRLAWVVVLAALDSIWERPDADSDTLSEWFDRSLRKLKLAALEVDLERA